MTEDQGGGIPKSNVWKYLLGTIGLVGIGGGVYLWYRKRNKDSKENDTANQHSSEPAK